MVHGALVVAASALSLIPVSDRPGALKGFQKFDFGMSMEKVSSLAGVAPKQYPIGGGFVVIHGRSAQMSGSTFNISFLFKNNQLVQVGLIREFAPAWSCGSEFVNEYKDLVRLYGSSDKPYTVSNPPVTYKVDFDFWAGGKIELNNLSLAPQKKCLESIIFRGVGASRF